MELDLRLWKYGEDDHYIESFLSVRSLAHNEKKKDEQWFHWKFEQSPYGKSIMAMAFDGDVVAGCVALGMGRFSYKGKEYKCALSYDTFVNKDYQGHGLFKKLINLAEEEAKRQQVELLYNFPNYQSITGFRHMGWVYRANESIYKIHPVKPFRMLLNAKSIKQPFIANPSNINDIKHLEFAGEEHTHTSNDNCVRMNWHPDYLKWRFLTYPNAEYYVMNGDVFGIARIGKRGNLKEAQVLLVQSRKNETLTKEDFKKFIKELTKAVSPDFIGVSVSEQSDIYGLLGFYLKVPNRSNFTYKVLGNEVQEDCGFALNAIDYHTY